MELREAIQHAKEVAEGCASGCTCAYQHDKLVDWLEELTAFKDLENQGKLISSDFYVGQKVWHNEAIDSLGKRKKPYPLIVTQVTKYKADELWIVAEVESGGHRRCAAMSEFYATKEAAQNALKTPKTEVK